MARSGFSFSEIHRFMAHAVDMDPTPVTRRLISNLPYRYPPGIGIIPLILVTADASADVAVTSNNFFDIAMTLSILKEDDVNILLLTVKKIRIIG
jgi:hypothetical protein